MSKKFEVLNHTGNLKLRSIGATIDESFSNMAYGMFYNIMGEHEFDQIKDSDLPFIVFPIDIEASDIGALLIDFLNELLYLSDLNNLVFIESDIKIEGSKLNGVIRGRKVSHFKYEVKAATYNDLNITQENNNWVSEVVFDI